MSTTVLNIKNFDVSVEPKCLKCQYLNRKATTCETGCYVAGDLSGVGCSS